MRAPQSKASRQGTKTPRRPRGRLLSCRARSLVGKTALVSALVVTANVVGNYTLGVGLRQVGELVTLSPLPYVHAFANGWVTIGVVFMLLWLLTRLALLSWADLSYVLPVTSFAYVLTALLGRWLLGERVSWMRWGGIAAITLGVALVALTYPHSPETDEVVAA